MYSAMRVPKIVKKELCLIKLLQK